MKKRNPDAHCSNCPYWEDGMATVYAEDTWIGICVRYPPPEKILEQCEDRKDGGDVYFVESAWEEGPFTGQDWVCGEHPNFLIEEATNG